MMTRILLALIYVQNIIIIPHLAVTQLMRVIEWPLSDSYGSCVNKNARVLIKGFTAYNTLNNFSRKHRLILSYFWIKTLEYNKSSQNSCSIIVVWLLISISLWISKRFFLNDIFLKSSCPFWPQCEWVNKLLRGVFTFILYMKRGVETTNAF